MPEDYYGDGEAASQPAPEAKPQGDAQEGQQTFLVPKAACPGMSVGDPLNSRVVAVHEEEYECQYVPESKEESGEAEAPMPQSMGPEYE